MRAQPSELKFAHMYQAQRSFEGLSREQYRLIMERGRALHHWYKTHHAVHCLISFSVLIFLIAADFLVLLYLPQLWLVRGEANPASRQLLAAMIVSLLHPWLIYSLGVCRISGGDPLYYAERHMIHHAKFGTEDDEEFLNFITPRRYWLTFLPFASLLNFSDFVAHRSQTFTGSRLVSVLVASVYHGLYAYLTYRAWGLCLDNASSSCSSQSSDFRACSLDSSVIATL